MSKQPQDKQRSQRAARLFKKHEAAYRALINLLIRQVERELRERDAPRTAADQQAPEDRKDAT